MLVMLTWALTDCSPTSRWLLPTSPTPSAPPTPQMGATELLLPLRCLLESLKFVQLTDYLKNRKIAKYSYGLVLTKTLISHLGSFPFFFHFYLETLDISDIT